MILAATLAGERGTYLPNSVMIVNNNNDAFVCVLLLSECFYKWSWEHYCDVAFIIPTLHTENGDPENWVTSSGSHSYFMAGLEFKHPFCYTSTISIKGLDKLCCCRVGEGKNRVDCSFLLIRTDLKYWRKTK